MRWREIVQESKVHKLNRVPKKLTWGELTTTVYEDPTATQMRTVMAALPDGHMRGLIDTDGRLYIWPARDATHMDIIIAMHLRDPLPFVLIRKGEEVLSDWQKVKPVAENGNVELLMTPSTLEDVSGSRQLLHLFPSLRLVTEEGKIVAGVNTTPDVQPGETQRQGAKMGFTLDANGLPPIWTGLASFTNAKDTANSGDPFYDADGTHPHKAAPIVRP